MAALAFLKGCQSGISYWTNRLKALQYEIKVCSGLRLDLPSTRCYPGYQHIQIYTVIILRQIKQIQPNYITANIVDFPPISVIGIIFTIKCILCYEWQVLLEIPFILYCFQLKWIDVFYLLNYAYFMILINKEMISHIQRSLEPWRPVSLIWFMQQSNRGNGYSDRMRHVLPAVLVVAHDKQKGYHIILYIILRNFWSLFLTPQKEESYWFIHSSVWTISPKFPNIIDNQPLQTQGNLLYLSLFTFTCNQPPSDVSMLLDHL